MWTASANNLKQKSAGFKSRAFLIFSSYFKNHPKERSKKFWAVHNDYFHKKAPPLSRFAKSSKKKKNNKKNDYVRQKTNEKPHEKSRREKDKGYVDIVFSPFQKSSLFSVFCMISYAKNTLSVT